MDDVLLMTATIDPGPTPTLTLRDPEIRLRHYVMALALWCRKGPFDRIVFCENSGKGHLLSAAIKSVKGQKNVELLTFEGNQGSWEFGKGFGEGGILDRAFAESSFIREAGMVWKATGRIYVDNASELAEVHQKDALVMNHEDTRFFKVRQDLFKVLLQPTHQQINDHRGTSIEVAYRRVLAPLVGSGGISRFHEQPRYIGQDAGSGNWHLPFPDGLLGEASRILSAQV